ncbi:unnamed protein product [Fraxinus pennsylvanica]|uniref:Homeodomain-like protein n=1 Tax=Fraxinus pennsylvanica TaxID=56036 RepID=A0AAD1ZZY8_9LAMI|nr:unnamed protein product [Fraxinus pennsylvanica]
MRTILDVYRASQNTLSSIRVAADRHFSFKQEFEKGVTCVDPESAQAVLRRGGAFGVKNAGPKTIVQIMNVDGLTRETVASHLQKYMLYNKRMKESPSASDHMFASAPVFRQQSFDESPSVGNVDYSDSGHYGIMPIPMQYPQLMPIPMTMGIAANMNLVGRFHDFEAHSHHNYYQQLYNGIAWQKMDMYVMWIMRLRMINKCLARATLVNC